MPPPGVNRQDAEIAKAHADACISHKEQEAEVRLLQASMRVGILALPVRVKANSPEVKRGGDAGPKGTQGIRSV